MRAIGKCTWPGSIGLVLSFLLGAAQLLTQGVMPVVWITLFLLSLMTLAFGIGARWIMFKERDPQMAKVIGTAILWAPTVYQTGRAVHRIVHHNHHR